MLVHNFLTRSITTTAFSLSSPDVISSRKMSLGFIANAQARAKRFLSPPDSPRKTTPPAKVPPMGRVLAFTGRPTRSSISFTRLFLT
mmetsp:Transcript_23427/g.33466  ORF Transcript_23427/g.33466 Transcript_23427/m.33466 type:complete len:87 (-) Transcript_23427:567-827(-)